MISARKTILVALFQLVCPFFLLAFPSNSAIDDIVSGRTESAVAKLSEVSELAWNIHQRFEKDWTLLHYAAKYGNSDLCLQLIRLGAEVNLADDQGNASLHIASQFGNVKCVTVLALKGASLNLPNLEGKTPLHFAVEYGNEEIEDALLRMGARRDVLDKDGNPPRDYSISKKGKIHISKKVAPDQAAEAELEMLWNSVKNDIKLYNSDKEKITDFLYDSNLDVKTKKSLIYKILKERGIDINTL